MRSYSPLREPGEELLHLSELALLELPRGLTARQLAGGFGLVEAQGSPDESRRASSAGLRRSPTLRDVRFEAEFRAPRLLAPVMKPLMRRQFRGYHGDLRNQLKRLP